MNVQMDWDNPEMVGLHDRLTDYAQQVYEDSLSPDGAIADPDSFADRIADAVIAAALDGSCSGSGWLLQFRPPKPCLRAGVEKNTGVFCVYCAATEGQLHGRHCARRGVFQHAPAVSR